LTQLRNSTGNVPNFDPEAIRKRYERERAKRMTESGGVIDDITGDQQFSEYTRTPHTPFMERDPVLYVVETFWTRDAFG